MFAAARRPVVFDPYRRRRRVGLPRWLWLLLLGAAAGAAGVLYVQLELLPPRLSADDSAQLRQQSEQATTRAASLHDELARTAQQLAAAQTDNRRLAAEAGSHRDAASAQRQDLAAVVAALPPDPRAATSAVDVRAGRFSARDGALDYEVVISRDGSNSRGGKPLAGVMQLLLAGDGAAAGSVAVNGVALSLVDNQVLRGSVALPAGFRPRQATVQVLDRSAGKLLGTRVLNVK